MQIRFMLVPFPFARRSVWSPRAVAKASSNTRGYPARHYSFRARSLSSVAGRRPASLPRRRARLGSRSSLRVDCLPQRECIAMGSRLERSNRAKQKSAGNVAGAYLALLADRGVDYLFGNAGTDFAPLIEAYARAAQTGVAVPRPILATHENLAVAMAHGYGMVSRRIPVVMAHVSVGTANMVCAALNAARENVAILLTAGRSPLTETGLLGSRDGYIHWAQEMYDQAGMIREIVKWDYELRNAEQLVTVVDRALAIAASEP